MPFPFDCDDDHDDGNPNPHRLMAELHAAAGSIIKNGNPEKAEPIMDAITNACDNTRICDAIMGIVGAVANILGNSKCDRHRAQLMVNAINLLTMFAIDKVFTDIEAAKAGATQAEADAMMADPDPVKLVELLARARRDGDDAKLMELFTMATAEAGASRN